MTIVANGQPVPYSLSEAFLNGQTFEIDQAHHAKLSEALTTVVSAMKIEELFQVFAQSFLRFEKDILDVAFEYAYSNMRTHNNDIFFSSVRNRFNVNIITILTSYRSYDDQSNAILNTSSGLSETQEFNCQISNEANDANLSYRICAKLRNYAQHRALPLGGFSIGDKANLGRDESGNLVKQDTGYNVSPWLNVSEFKSSSQCKASLRNELESLGCEKIDMKWLIRSFAAAMYERHAKLRARLKPEIAAAGETITEGYDLFSAVKKSEAKFLDLCGDGKNRPMRKDLSAKVLRDFETYRSLQYAARAYVTSQIEPGADTYPSQVDGSQSKCFPRRDGCIRHRGHLMGSDKTLQSQISAVSRSSSLDQRTIGSSQTLTKSKSASVTH